LTVVRTTRSLWVFMIFLLIGYPDSDTVG